MKKILFILGTRPEAIKLIPVIKKFKGEPDSFETKICVTAQHREMLNQILDFFAVYCDYNLNIMRENQSLFEVTSDGLRGLGPILEEFMPDLVFVQGDTTTALIGALAGFYKKVRIAHVEAGLRSENKLSPFPEEMNRVLIAQLANYHFAPTDEAKNNLLHEGIFDNAIRVVGNTVIDSLFLTIETNRDHEDEYQNIFSWLDLSKTIILVTSHRRESFGEPLSNICMALKEIAQNPNIEIIYPVHLNPNVRRVVFELLNNYKNIHLLEPLLYPHLVWLMQRSYLVLTDSGGIQEEAPALGKPVLVMRDVTERVEGIRSGSAKLVGTNQTIIVSEVIELLTDRERYREMSCKRNPYGDGTASAKILNTILQVFE
jgi:UDP-N-acetylglucosamine 2-epimerase (non-hydrolysing)